jgi:hypothetical protein
VRQAKRFADILALFFNVAIAIAARVGSVKNFRNFFGR